MSFGKMNRCIDIQEKRPVVDEEGFRSIELFTVATVRAYREGRHGSERWANRAAFTDATDLFRFRGIPGVEVATDMVIRCDDRFFEITSVEDVKGRGMYIEVLAREVHPSGQG
jgi:SPP1 family predicted phage head-tail adaptor